MQKTVKPKTFCLFLLLFSTWLQPVFKVGTTIVIPFIVIVVTPFFVVIDIPLSLVIGYVTNDEIDLV